MKRKTIKKSLVLFLSLLMIISAAFAISAHNTQNQKNVSEDESVIIKGFANKEKTAEYVFYSDGTLEVSGTGSVYVYEIFSEDGNGRTYFNDKVKKIIVDEGITELSDGAFRTMGRVTEISLPESLEKIGVEIFMRATLKEFYIPASLKEVDDNTFEDLIIGKFRVSPENKDFCLDENGVLFSADKTILYAAPSEMKAESYTIPEGTVELRTQALYNCKNLKRVTVPDSLYIIGTAAFGDDVLESAEEDNGIYYIGNIAVGMTDDMAENSEKISFREGTVAIYPFAFCYGNFSEFDFPKSLKSICNGAFCGTEIFDFNFPPNLEYIGTDAFDNRDCFVLPASVKKIGPFFVKKLAILNPEFKFDYEYSFYRMELIVGYSGSTAEKFAKENSIYFASIDEGHEHVYFEEVITPATCTENGKSLKFCPCGKTGMITVYPVAKGHNWNWNPEEDEDGIEYWFCSDCDEITYENPFGYHYVNCDCICHKDGFSKIVYKFLRFFWKLFRINEVCLCGELHY